MTLDELRAAIIAIADMPGASAADVAECVYELAEQLAPTARCGRREPHGAHTFAKPTGSRGICFGNVNILVAKENA
jgi:hypothetical protein